MPKRRQAPKGSARWLIGRDRIVGTVLATLAFLPFAETLLYELHVGAGVSHLRARGYLALAPVVVLLWLLMIVSFLIEPGTARQFLERLRSKLRRAQRTLRQKAIGGLLAIPAVLALLILGGNPLVKSVSWFDVFQSFMFPLVQLTAVGLLV